jgi:hypothetical protein
MVGIAWLYVLTLYLQEVLGHGALMAGLLAMRVGVRTTAVSGLVLVAVGLLLMTPMSVGGGLGFVLCGMVIGESGFMRRAGVGRRPLEHLRAVGQRLGLGWSLRWSRAPLLHWAVRRAAPKFWSVACGAGSMLVWALPC